MALIYNLIHDHPDLKILVHRLEEYQLETDLPLNIGTVKYPVFDGIDPFVFEQNDLKKTCAAESSLWEIQCLENHYLPQVSEMAVIFKENLRDSKPGFNINNFLKNSYETFFKEEIEEESVDSSRRDFGFEKNVFIQE